MNKFFTEVSTQLSNLKDYISYINVQTNSILKIADRNAGKETVLEYISVNSSTPMPNLITVDVVTNIPLILPVFVDYDDSNCENFSFPKHIYCNSNDGMIFLSLHGMIGYKTSDDTFIVLSKFDEHKWIKYDRGLEFFNKEELPNYHIDIGFGHALVLFYRRIDDSRKNSFLSITTPVQKRCIIESIEQSNPDMKIFRYSNRAQRQKRSDVQGLIINKAVGISNPNTNSHLNAIVQALFLIKNFVFNIETVGKASKASPVYELAIMFSELKKPGPPVEPRNLLHAINLLEEPTNDIIETFSVLLKKLNVVMTEREFDVYKFYGVANKQMLSDLILRIKTNTSSIMQSIESEYSKINFEDPPMILIVKICPTSNDNKRAIIPFEMEMPSGSNQKYSMYSIIAKSDNYYMIFNKITKDDWIGIYDDIAVDIPSNMIKFLFGARKNSINCIKQYLGRQFHAELLFFKRNEVDLNNESI